MDAMYEELDDEQHKMNFFTVAELTRQLLVQFGYDTYCDEDVKDTPKRVANFWREFLEFEPGNCSTTFPDTGAYGQMVVVTEIEFMSMCSHHLLPFIGKMDVGYIPGKRVIGLSKIPRIVNQYTHKLQLQERIGRQIAEQLPVYLSDENCLGVGVVIGAIHTCMCGRGPRSFSPTITRHFTGQFLDNVELRNEFYQLAGKWANLF